MNEKNEVILIEDDSAIVDVYKIAMESEKINLKVMTMGRDALKEIEGIQSGRREKPALILLDLMLPDVSGTEILKKIKENSKSSDIAVFVLSNYATPELAGLEGIFPDRFILKTAITPIDLTKLVKEQLKSKK